MKILVLNYEFPPLGGGAANATKYILKEFAKNKNLHIDLITSSIDKYKEENLEGSENRIRIFYLDIEKHGNIHYQSNKDLLQYSRKAYSFAKELINKQKYNLVHAFFGIPCGYIAMKLGLPYIVSLRGSDVPFYNSRFHLLDTLIFKRLSGKIWKRSSAVIANSDGLRQLALKSFPEQKIGVIYNGVDIEEFSPLTEYINNKKITLISTGRLIQRKAYDLLIKALEGISDIKLILIGDGNQKEELSNLSKELKVEVEFLGSISHDEIPKHLRQADVFVLPSLNEGMSNSLLEAMACGLPVIATDVGGSNELIMYNGFIVEKENIDDLREKIMLYISDKELIKKHSGESLYAIQSFSWTKVSNEYLQVYNKLSTDK